MLLNDYAKETRRARDNNCADASDTTVFSKSTIEEQQLFFPVGILGFPASRRFRLEKFRPDDGSDSPFLTLKCLDEELTFVLIQPHSLGIEYRAALTKEILDALSASSEKQLSVLLIVTVRDVVDDITINLQGPLIINPATSLGIQQVVEEYPLRYPLLRRLET